MDENEPSKGRPFWALIVVKFLKADSYGEIITHGDCSPMHRCEWQTTVWPADVVVLPLAQRDCLPAPLTEVLVFIELPSHTLRSSSPTKDLDPFSQPSQINTLQRKVQEDNSPMRIEIGFMHQEMRCQHRRHGAELVGRRGALPTS